MKRSIKLCVVTLILVLALGTGFTTLASAQDSTVDMVVAPNVLSLDSKGGVVTLHVEIGFSAGYELELLLNNQPLPILFTFPDSRGELVIRCSLSTVKSMVEAGEATFDLTINDTITGTDTIRVIDPEIRK